MKPPQFENIYSIENLNTAWHKVSLGKSGKPSIIDFYCHLDSNLQSISKDLQNNTYLPGSYKRFLITDPKKRIISASTVRDRVVQHALMNHYEGIFDRHLIFDCYACRVGKGTHQAILRAFHFAKSSDYFLKMDVQKYFDSIDHATLKNMLLKMIKDKKAFDLFSNIIDSSKIYEEKGLPIGNLTSQFFANHYLSSFDHYFKEQSYARKYIRYMDDILVFSNSKNELKVIYDNALKYTNEKLKLNIKLPVIDTVNNGVPFLGFLVKPNGIYLQQKTKKRYKVRIANIEHKRKIGAYSDLEAGRRVESVTAHLLIARSIKFRNNVLYRHIHGV